MMLFAALCIGLGVVPGPLYAMLPFAVDFVPYTASTRRCRYLQLLLFSGLAFFLMLGWLKRTLTITLDVDWFYRRLGLVLTASLDRWAEISVECRRQCAGSARSSSTRRRSAISWTRWCSGPHLADRRDGVLDDHHAGRLSCPVIPVIKTQ